MKKNIRNIAIPKIEAIPKIAGIIALAAVIGFALITCTSNSPGGSSSATAPTITTASLPGGIIGIEYSQTLKATGTTPVTWSIESSDLPDGLSLASNGVISGTPSAIETFTFTVKAINSVGSNTKELFIKIAPATTPVISFVAAGRSQTIAIKTDGTLWAWGRGGLGDGTYGSDIPLKIGSDTDWKTASVGYGHIIAIKTDGTLWACGGNSRGQLGDGTTNSRNILTQIGSDTNWASVIAGNSHSIAIKTDGTLWAWGWNYYGQLGDSTTNDSLVPKQIGSDTNWKTIVGESHSIAIKTDGSLWAWGDNSNGKLGDGTYTNRNVPTQIGLDTNWAAVSAGIHHTIAIKTDGSLWGWGGILMEHWETVLQLVEILQHQ